MAGAPSDMARAQVARFTAARRRNMQAQRAGLKRLTQIAKDLLQRAGSQTGTSQLKEPTQSTSL